MMLEITLDLDLLISEEMEEDLQMAKDPDLVALEETVEMQEELDQAMLEMLEEQGLVEGQELEETKEIQEDQE